MGRKKAEGVHRRPNGRPSEARGARGAHDELQVMQPHRRPFVQLLGEQAAGSYAASFALGRLRLIGEAEEKSGRDTVRRFLHGLGDAAKHPGPFGIRERLFFAGMRYSETVGRERFVRASPKDKPSAMAFLSARGIDLNPREMTPAQQARYLVEFEEARAALTAAPCSPDMRSVLRTLRKMARAVPEGGDMVRLLRGIGALANPAASGAVQRAVDIVVLDDRDPDEATLANAILGFEVLADHYYGPERDDVRPIRGVVFERPLWQHDAKAIEIAYRNADGSTRKAGERPKEEAQSASKGGWRGRHRSHAG
jgi:hypothetical protein